MVATLCSAAVVSAYRDWGRATREGACRWGVEWLSRSLGETVPPGTTVTVGARTNVGKTFFALELLHGMAVSGPVVYMSYEDSPVEIGRRLASGYDHPNLHCAFPDPGSMLYDFEAVCNGPLKPVAVAVDYVQTAGFTAEVLTGVMNGLRARTRASGVVSVICSQVGRPPPGEPEHGVPGQHRLKGAGAIEERSDVIIMLGAGKDRTLLAEVTKAKGAPVGARARYKRGEGGRLVLTATKMDTDEEDSE